jgi:predicted transcriptional regulator with HTH domain
MNIPGTQVSIGIRRFYRLIKVLIDLKVIKRDQKYLGFNLYKVENYSARVLNIIEDKK